MKTGATAECIVNDRGPYAYNRLIDVSRAVAEDLGMLNRGVTKVRIRVVGRGG